MMLLLLKILDSKLILSAEKKLFDVFLFEWKKNVCLFVIYKSTLTT